MNIIGQRQNEGMTRRKEISSALWKRIEPLIPQVKRSPKGGRPRIIGEQALNGIIYVLRTGALWEALQLREPVLPARQEWRRARWLRLADSADFGSAL
ncbi:hypothetical protein XACJK48_9020006 [Xanthomonas citri pv. citri]|uniref:Insertion element IS402-like domain-containing protein n=2 Tax=Gammaproteobacteria TaxID=1236 RepID=A0A0U5F9Y8_XANCI|nr:hypothetical protein XAC902_1970010 [Xanthomonas citri pv. citri]CEE56898.1 hypothetical protein XACS584_1660002 [Xanthomonas citri pv. citri]CEE64260.1 hypothetical protein XAC3608_2140003 [Xanthomonas citri pv. citri]CEE80449.1 hypothetical protein XACLE20_1990002 [Xanthomonas citri pv. citri]CEG15130.1 hypothetical protein XAC3562_1750002 [Xanthomonas citri pv. citri]